MHTVEMMEQAVAAAKRLGFRVRMDWLGGEGGGGCEVRGEKWIFIDLATNADEQLETVLSALGREADESVLPLPIQPNLQSLLNRRKSA